MNIKKLETQYHWSIFALGIVAGIILTLTTIIILWNS